MFLKAVLQRFRQFLEERVKLQQSLTVVGRSRQPQSGIELSEESLVDFWVGLRVRSENSTKIFEGSPITVDFYILSRD